mgnify:CR=1 FL=1
MLSRLVSAEVVIYGFVTDSLSYRPLTGANVYLERTALGQATDIEGFYRLSRIPEGRYSLRVSYIGYVSKRIDISLEGQQELELNIQLVPDVLQGQSVKVTGQFSGQAAAINQQITSNTIINVVSEEKIQELPDANAAEAIGRLPGVSIQRSGGEASKIVLRGLSDRFSSISVDGVRIAATDANSRGVDLSTISQGSLAGVELYKALTPDKDADAIAGSVNLVTRKAPSERLLRLDLKGSYNDMDQSYNQYDFNFRYGKRFWKELLGVQLTANTEKRVRSREYYYVDYNQNLNEAGTEWEISDLSLEYTNEIRKRSGISLLLDLATPDGGTIRFNNIYNKTARDYIEYGRNYPTGSSDDLEYSARDREQSIYTYNSFLKGDNYLAGLNFDWGLALALSKSEYPYDYEINFLEPSALDDQGNPISHMLHVPVGFKGPLEELVGYALNNFDKAYFNTAFFRDELCEEVDINAFVNITKGYTLGNRFSGEIKVGTKYNSKARSRSQSELFAPYYNVPFSEYTRLADGSVIRKDFSGTLFENYNNVGGKIILFNNFVDEEPVSRDIFDRYSLYPLINRDALRKWWDLNKDGCSSADGSNPEYHRNREADLFYYDIEERVPAAYLMNSFNIGQKVTWIAGVRVESENNDYKSRFSPSDLSGFPVPTGQIRDTTATHQETVWLPNTHLNFRLADFINLRLAAYKALARPDFNRRLANYSARKYGTFYQSNSFIIGNPDLKAAQAWNYEVNTSFFGKNIGLFSVSAFYKDIKDMYHLMDALLFKGRGVLDSLGVQYIPSFADQLYELTYPYNSQKPTRVWGIEVEHQANFRFLPGLLKNFVLNYNFTIVRSETYIPSVRIEEYLEQLPGLPFATKKYRYLLQENKQKLEGQPEFFGNLSVGYDIKGFSARISVYHQGEFNRTFSPTRRSDTVENEYTRWDLAIRQKITPNIVLMMSLNNLSDTKEGTNIINRINHWNFVGNRERYGMTADFGIRIEL